MKGYEGESFLNRIYQDLHLSEEVMHTASKSDQKEEKVRKYLERLERVEELAKNRKPHGFELFKELFYQKYVIKPENIPDSYFEHQKKMALERGYGHVDYTEEQKEQMKETIIQDQKKSLDQWLEYFIENDAKYPEWFKYYAFQGMVKLGSYNKETRKFNKRTESTTNIFVDLNYEALALVYDSLSKFIEGKEIEEELLKKLLEGGSFSKLYSYMIQKIDSVKKDSIDSKEGIWIKYPKGSNPEELVQSIEGRGTGWCSAGLETARVQLQEGDFYIYYTKDSDGEYKQPRIAIRMEDDRIGEIRGIAANQNLESEMEEVVKEKLKEFPDRERYYKKVEDMEKLTKIYEEYRVRELDNEELRFLYQIDHQILGFGYREDPRIKEIIGNRNYQEDLSKIFGCKKEEVSNDIRDILFRKKIVCFYGNLDLRNAINNRTIQSYKDFKLPEYVIGDLRLSTLTNLNGIQLPRIVSGYLDLSGLESAKGLVLPEKVNGDLDLSGLENAEGLVLPEVVNGGLDLNGLKNAEGLNLPETLNGGLDLSGLVSAEGLNLPETLNGGLDLSGLVSAEGLNLPETLNGGLDLISLKNAEGLVLPKIVNGDLYLSGLKNAEGLNLPETINGSLDLISLKNAEGLVLPKIVNGDLYLNVLKNAEGLNLPETINGSLYLSGLKNAEGLNLPETINGDLILDGLENAEGLNLPETINGSLYLNGLKNAEGLVLPKIVNGDLYLSGLKNAEGLNLPETINGDLDLKGLVNAEGLKLPETINGDLDLKGLENAEGLIVPKGFSYSKVSSPYFTIQDLINKSLEQKNEKGKTKKKTKQEGFTKVGILILVNLLVSIGIIVLGVILMN